ncbi:hypothetical protein FRB90_010751 [Tulasnella sp. 427]|nr:hypothetical protein FRB90_010751 [Tulasnella sp. 427]
MANQLPAEVELEDYDKDKDNQQYPSLSSWSIRQLYSTLAQHAAGKDLAGGGHFYASNVPYFADDLDDLEALDRAQRQGTLDEEAVISQDPHLHQNVQILRDASFKGDNLSEDEDLEVPNKKGKGREVSSKAEVSAADVLQGLIKAANLDEEDTFLTKDYARCTENGSRFVNDVPIFLHNLFNSPTTTPKELAQARLLYSQALLGLKLTTPPLTEAYKCSEANCQHRGHNFDDLTKLHRHIHLHHINPSLKAQYKRRVTGCPYCVLWVIQNTPELEVLEELRGGPEILDGIDLSEWENIANKDLGT